MAPGTGFVETCLTLSVYTAGMVQSEQDEVLRLFRDGHHKIIIATSVAEEGLDVQACNFVMRYEHVTNETARIQARGECRHISNIIYLKQTIY